MTKFGFVCLGGNDAKIENMNSINDWLPLATHQLVKATNSFFFFAFISFLTAKRDESWHAIVLSTWICQYQNNVRALLFIFFALVPLLLIKGIVISSAAEMRFFFAPPHKARNAPFFKSFAFDSCSKFQLLKSFGCFRISYIRMGIIDCALTHCAGW